MNSHAIYKEIMHQIPDVYKLKNFTATSLTYSQILACLNIYLEKDKRNDGWIYVNEMVELIRGPLRFKVSETEVCYMLKDMYDDDIKDIKKMANEKVNFATFIRIIDTLKVEKLVLVQLGNNLNYFIFAVLVLLIALYISLFYSYKGLP